MIILEGPDGSGKSTLIKELEKLKGEGNDPNEVLNQSIMRSYTGVFPLKNGNITRPRDIPKEYSDDWDK